MPYKWETKIQFLCPKFETQGSGSGLSALWSVVITGLKYHEGSAGTEALSLGQAPFWIY